VDAEQRSDILEHHIRVPDLGAHLVELRDLMSRKHQLKPLYVRVRIPSSLAGAQPAFLNAALLQQLLAQHPD
jgi:hypothetical protein